MRMVQLGYTGKPLRLFDESFGGRSVRRIPAQQLHHDGVAARVLSEPGMGEPSRAQLVQQPESRHLRLLQRRLRLWMSEPLAAIAEHLVREGGGEGRATLRAGVHRAETVRLLHRGPTVRHRSKAPKGCARDLLPHPRTAAARRVVICARGVRPPRSAGAVRAHRGKAVAVPHRSAAAPSAAPLAGRGEVRAPDFAARRMRGVRRLGMAGACRRQGRRARLGSAQAAEAVLVPRRNARVAAGGGVRSPLRRAARSVGKPGHRGPALHRGPSGDRAARGRRPLRELRRRQHHRRAPQRRIFVARHGAGPGRRSRARRRRVVPARRGGRFGGSAARGIRRSARSARSPWVPSRNSAPAANHS